MHRPTQPSPATSTTFSCQLSSTLIDAPLLSFCAPGRPDICEKPVLWGVRFEPRAPGRPDEEEVADVEDAMPLYLWLYVSALIYTISPYPILYVLYPAKESRCQRGRTNPGKREEKSEESKKLHHVQILH
jgi:hypothetical protein